MSSAECSFFEQFFNSIRLAQSKGQKPLVVIDIDSTLVHVHTRNQMILRTFFEIEDHKTRFPSLAQKVSKLEFLPNEWGLSDTLKKGGLEALPDSLMVKVNDYWVENFFSNLFLGHDVLVDGAVEFVKELHARRVDVLYLTGRDEARMGEGTRTTFANWGFPLNEHAKLSLKLDTDVTDENYKQSVLSEYVQQFQPIWFFENEPLNLQMAADHFPQIQLVQLDTTHSGRGKTPPLTIMLKSFKGFLEFQQNCQSI